MVCYLLSVGLKQAGCVGFVFPREFFVSGVTCSARAPSVALVTSPGKLPSPLKLLSSLFCGVTALARSWTSLVGFVVRVQRAGFQVSLARVGARSYEFRSTRELQEREEKREGASLARRFKQSVFWTSPKVAGPIRVSVWGGAPPMSMVFWGHAHSSSDI